MTIQAADVVLIRMQFHQASGSKVRPALVLLDTGDQDFVAAPVTSQSRLSDFDFAINDWRAAGLNVPSSARIHKLTVLAKTDIISRLGTVSDADRRRLAEFLCRIFCPGKETTQLQ